MAKVELETNTLAVLVAGMYCTDHQVDSMAIPQSLWIQIAEKLEYFLPDWDFDKISFEEWIRTHLLQGEAIPLKAQLQGGRAFPLKVLWN